jgi:hypothetical protein
MVAHACHSAGAKFSNGISSWFTKLNLGGRANVSCFPSESLRLKTGKPADDEQGVVQVAAESEHSAPSAAAVALAKDQKCSVAVVFK